MTNAPPQEVPLVRHLIELAQRQERGALAALRAGKGKPPGSVSRMLTVIAPFLSADGGPATRASFITASLFAGHPQHAPIGSLGASLWKATMRDGNPEGKHGEAGVEARLTSALDADPEDLPRHLEGLVSLCESAGVPINWHRFYWDVQGLLGSNEDYRNRIRIHWAREFWRGPSESMETNETDREEDEV